MHRAFAIGILSLGSAALAASACSAGYTSTGIVADGSLGGACFPNDTCDDGLACVSQQCVAGYDAGGDGGASDETRDAGPPVDAPTVDPFMDASTDAGPCGALPPPLDPACFDAGSHVCFSDNVDGAACSAAVGGCNEQFQCNAMSQCGSGQFCCLMGGKPLGSRGCPDPIEANGSNCGPSCNVTNPAVCIGESDCPSGFTCLPAQITHDTVTYAVVGVCISN